MDKQRLKKLENLSREILSALILEELPDRENIFGIISIDRVEISSDLSYLDIWISSIKNGDKLTKTLAKYNNAIQGRYNRQINIRKLPKIRYRYDNKGEIGQRIGQAINDLHK